MTTDLTVPPAARERLLVRFGPAAGPWCDALPEQVAAFARRWSLRPAEQLGGGTSRVVVCRDDGGRRVYLKLTPDPAVAAQEAEALRLWHASGCTPRLLAADPERGALLLAEVAGPDGGPAPALPAGEARLDRVTELLTALRGPVGTPGPVLPTLAGRVDFVFALIRRRMAAAAGRTAQGGPDPAMAGLLDRGRREALALAASGPARLVHGDLHAGNVLDTGAVRGLVAIDPRPAVGDPDFDAVDWALAGVTSTAGLHARIRVLAGRVPGLDADRLHRWCLATAILAAGPRAARGVRNPHTRLLLDLAALAGAST